MQFIGALREITDCGLTDAKGVVQHVTTRHGQCHWCESAIGEFLLADCSQCGALNIQLGRPMKDVTCPACGFHVLADGYGSYEICEICGWEDDGVQLANPTSSGGANKQSLAEVQAETLGRIPLDCTRHGDRHRDPCWRPLKERALDMADKKRVIEHWHTLAVVNRGDAYWLRTEVPGERTG
jgi:ribosomal protein S27E